jgi:D-hexose-6-phosphate mutarotase
MKNAKSDIDFAQGAERVRHHGGADRRDREAGQEATQHSHTLELLPGRAIDRIIGGPAGPLRLNDLQAQSQRSLLIEPTGFDDVVVWNPGPGHGLPDLPDEGWRDFVCLEVGQINRPARVEPGESWCAMQRVSHLQG